MITDDSARWEIPRGGSEELLLATVAHEARVAADGYCKRIGIAAAQSGLLYRVTMTLDGHGSTTEFSGSGSRQERRTFLSNCALQLVREVIAKEPQPAAPPSPPVTGPQPTYAQMANRALERAFLRAQTAAEEVHGEYARVFVRPHDLDCNDYDAGVHMVDDDGEFDAGATGELDYHACVEDTPIGAVDALYANLREQLVERIRDSEKTAREAQDTLRKLDAGDLVERADR